MSFKNTDEYAALEALGVALLVEGALALAIFLYVAILFGAS